MTTYSYVRLEFAYSPWSQPHGPERKSVVVLMGESLRSTMKEHFVPPRRYTPYYSNRISYSFFNAGRYRLHVPHYNRPVRALIV